MAKIQMKTPLVEMDGDEMNKNPLEMDQRNSSRTLYRPEHRVL